MFFRRTIVIRYVLNHIALFVCAFLVAIFSLEFGLAMSQNITFHDIMKDTGTWFPEFFLQHLDDHILIIFDSIAIVSLPWFHNFFIIIKFELNYFELVDFCAQTTFFKDSFRFSLRHGFSFLGIWSSGAWSVRIGSDFPFEWHHCIIIIYCTSFLSMYNCVAPVLKWIL